MLREYILRIQVALEAIICYGSREIRDTGLKVIMKRYFNKNETQGLMMGKTLIDGSLHNQRQRCK